MVYVRWKCHFKTFSPILVIQEIIFLHESWQTLPKHQLQHAKNVVWILSWRYVHIKKSYLVSKFFLSRTDILELVLSWSTRRKSYMVHKDWFIRLHNFRCLYYGPHFLCWISGVVQFKEMHSHPSTSHFICSTLFSPKYCSSCYL